MRFVEAVSLEPDIRHCDALARMTRPVEQAKVDRLVERLKASRDEHGRDEAYRHSGIPPLVLNAHQELVNGRHRQLACAIADVPPDGNVFQFTDHIEEQMQVILENLNRTNLTPEQEREDLRTMVLLTEQRNDAVGNIRQPAENPSKGGRPRSPQREAIREVAEKTGRSERTVERAVKEGSEPRPVVEREAKPPALEKRLAAVIESVRSAHSELVRETGQEDLRAWKDVYNVLDRAAVTAFDALGLAEKALWLLRDAKKNIARADFQAGKNGKQLNDTRPGAKWNAEQNGEPLKATIAESGKLKFEDGPKTGLGGRKL